MNSVHIGIIAAIFSTMSWAICSILFKKLGERLSSTGMTMMKTALSTIILYIICLITSSDFILPKSDLLPIAFSGILGIAIGDSLFFASLSRLSPIMLSIILFVGPDLFSGILGFICLKEKPSAISWIGIALILTGLLFYIFPVKKGNDTQKTQLVGIVFALLSLICTSYSMVIIKPVLAVSPTIPTTMYRMMFATIALFLYGIISKKVNIWFNVLKDKIYTLKLSATTSIATIGGFWLSLVAIKNIELIVASSVMSLEPLFIMIFMVLFYKYIPTKKEIAGVIFTIIGITCLCIN